MNVTATSSRQAVLDLDFQWFGKTSTRLAESFMMYFTPAVNATNQW